MMNKRLLCVRASDLLRDSLRYMKRKCNIDDDNGQGMKTYQSCMQLWASHFANRKITILTGELGRECIEEGKYRLRLGASMYTCHILEQLDITAVTGGILYLFHAPVVDTEEMSQTEAFYVESWQIALMDAGRLWMERYIRRQQPEGQYLSESFGPGFYGMELEAVASMVNFLGGEEVGISLLPDGMMEPAKSLAGLFLTGTKPFSMPAGDCLSCQATGNCRMCRHYAPFLAVK